MTALENVLVGHALRDSEGGSSARIFGTPRVRREEREAHDERARALALFGLAGRRRRARENLSYGDQRRLEVARALADGAEAAAARRADARG